jgi:myo-inositol 2-dehydrogenase/D-chiro-inositol 1-dehydrogenase
MPTATLNIGLIGAGRGGRLHAGHLAGQIPGARLATVADVWLAAAREVAARHGAPVATAEYGDVLADPAIDAVLIAAATAAHATLIAAAAAGKHIFCEKPIALSLAAIDGALAAVERAGVQLQIGFNRRFDANYRRVREAIVAGEIGRPESLHIISRDPAPPPSAYLATSGGLFLDMTIHDFDMARFLLGGEVTGVFATASALTDPAVAAAGDVDTAVVVLTFADGAIGTIENSRRAVYGYDQRVEILGSAGAIAIGNEHANTAVISDRGGVRRDPPLHFFMERYLASYRAELSAFVEAIRHDQPVPVGGIDGRFPVVLGLAAERSRREGRLVRPAEVEGCAGLPVPA